MKKDKCPTCKGRVVTCWYCQTKMTWPHGYSVWGGTYACHKCDKKARAAGLAALTSKTK